MTDGFWVKGKHSGGTQKPGFSTDKLEFYLEICQKPGFYAC